MIGFSPKPLQYNVSAASTRQTDQTSKTTGSAGVSASQSTPSGHKPCSAAETQALCNAFSDKFRN